MGECESRDDLDAQWRLVDELPGTRIFEPVGQESRYPTAMARVRWDAEPTRLYEYIWHYESFPEVIPNVIRSDVLERRDNEVWVYQQLRFPGPVSDRHYVLYSVNAGSDFKEGHYRVRWELGEPGDLPEGPSFPVPDAFKGCWDIRPGDHGGLDAVYWIELDPGGWVPDWAVRAGMRLYLADLMTALRQRLTTTAQHR